MIIFTALKLLYHVYKIKILKLSDLFNLIIRSDINLLRIVKLKNINLQAYIRTI